MRLTLNQVLDQLEDTGKLEDVDALYEAFSEWTAEGGRPLYPHQEEVFVELLEGKHVIAQTPTGSGKSLMALGAHFLSLARNGRSYYTAPLKALVSEKFFDLVAVFGARNVGMVTGDVSLNEDAPIICCTAEILANQSLREGKDMDVDVVVMDEFHFYSDPQRGWAWQVPLLQLPKAQFLALSATLGDVDELCSDLRRRTGREVSQVSDAVRPVPLEFDYCVDELPVVVERLFKEGRTPVYIVHFSQREAVATAKTLESVTFVSKDQKQKITDATGNQNFGRGFGSVLRGLLLQGIGVHHAGMLPRYRRLVEKLAQDGLLAVICGTDTLGVGINVPIRTVLFTSLIKYDGNKVRHLSAREFHQIAGRAGRAGFDTVGFVRAIASETEIEQTRRKAKMSAAQDEANEKKLKKLARKTKPKASAAKATWTRATFDRLVGAKPEAMQSQMRFNHALVLNVLSGSKAPEEDLLRLAQDNHETLGASNPHLRTLGQIYRSLRQAGIIEYKNSVLQVVGDLPDEFALNQPLAPFALAAFDLLDPLAPTFTLDLISVVESVMEDPLPLLYAQRRRERDSAFQTLKAEGVSFDERNALLDEISWPQPLKEILEPTFEVFRQTNPWVGHLELSPKSVVRQMLENAMTFTELISHYDLSTSEGVILRYLTDTYRALKQLLPERYVNDEMQQIIDWLDQLIRSVDSSLLDEWEALNSGVLTHRDVKEVAAQSQEQAFGADENGQILFSRNLYAFRKEIRNKVFRFVEWISRDDVEALARDCQSPWDEDLWDRRLGDLWQDTDWVGIDAKARSAELFVLDETPDRLEINTLVEDSPFDDVPLTEAGDLDWWVAKQILLDEEDTGQWRLVFLIDHKASLEKNEIVWKVLDFG